MSIDDIDDPVEPDGYRCWCGAELSDEDLGDMVAQLEGGCGGSGTVQCLCGGDMCVCHNHGEGECPGCEDCDEEDDEREDWWEDEVE